MDKNELSEVIADDAGDKKEISISISSKSKPLSKIDGISNSGSVSNNYSKNSPGITYTWSDINVWTNKHTKLCGFMKSKTSKKTSKHILKDGIGLAKPGQVLALMGSSGAGKTTLLNALTHRNLVNLTVTGERLINGVPTDSKQLKIISAYVQQDDLFISTLKVREYLTFYALLRLPGRVTRKERRKKVDEILKEFGLTNCSNTLIGSPWTERGCSGGELKRLAFACEFLTDPSLMFCDEPTSGLDSFMACTVVQSLKDMAAKGKTIICTIHQPPSDVFAMFDKILLLAEGRVAFCGDATDAIIFFENLSYNCPQNYNPADFFINTLAISPSDEAQSRAKVTEICDNFEQSSYYQFIKDSAILKERKSQKSILKKMFEKNKAYKANWCTQLGVLSWRAGLTIIRDPMVLAGRGIQTLAVAILLGLIYFGQELDPPGITNIRGSIFLSLVCVALLNMFSILNAFSAELPILLREHENGMYRVDIYFLSRLLAELPLQIILPITFTTILYWMVGFNSNLDRFLIACGIQFLAAYCASSFGCLMSCSTNSLNLALVFTPLFLLPLEIYSGFFLNINSIPEYLKWIKYFSWFYFSHEILAVNQWDGIEGIKCGNFSVLICPTGDMILSVLNFDKGNFNFDLMMLIVLAFGYTIAAFLALLIKSCRKS